MQNIEKRIAALETAKAKGRPWAHLTDAELDAHIEGYRVRMATEIELTEGEQNAEH